MPETNLFKGVSEDIENFLAMLETFEEINSNWGTPLVWRYTCKTFDNENTTPSETYSQQLSIPFLKLNYNRDGIVKSELLVTQDQPLTLVTHYATGK